MRGRRLPLVFAGIVMIAGCGAGPSSDGPAVVVRDSAGVAIVENSRPVWTPETAWRVMEAPALEIGVVDGPEAYQLDRVVGAVRFSDGRIAIGDGGSRRIRYYDAAGRHLHDAGGQGGGPGEFQSLSRIVAMPGDSVAGWDASARRLTAFDSDGRLGRTVTFDGVGGVAAALLGGFGDGSVVIAPGEEILEIMRREPGEYRRTMAYLRFTGDGAFIDTIATGPGAERVISRDDTSLSARDVLFGRDHHVALAEDRVYAGASDSYAIAVLGPDGALTRSIRRLIEPRVVARRELEQAVRRATDERARLAQRSAELMGGPVAAPDPTDFVHRDSYPAFDRLLADSDGNLWVRAYPAPEAESHSWSVFDPDGRWLGDVQLRGGLEVYEIGHDHLLARWRDEFDVDHVRMYRVEKP